MNVAEAIDMEQQATFKENKQEWLVYVVFRNSPEFLSSYGDGEEPVLSSTLARKENAPGFVKSLKRPRPKPG
jgi:hypothetical protein